MNQQTSNNLQTFDSDSYTNSLKKLTNAEQKLVKTTVYDLSRNPENPGHRFRKLEGAPDKNFWSARVSHTLRLIVQRSESNLLLCYVGHRNDAYDWANKRKSPVLPKAGAPRAGEIPKRVEENRGQKPVDEAVPRPPKPPRRTAPPQPRRPDVDEAVARPPKPPRRTVPPQPPRAAVDKAVPRSPKPPRQKGYSKPHRPVVDKAVARPPKPLLLEKVPDEVLLSNGVPSEWLVYVKNANEDSLLELASHLPAEAAQALLEIAVGGTPRPPKPPAPQAKPPRRTGPPQPRRPVVNKAVTRPPKPPRRTVPPQPSRAAVDKAVPRSPKPPRRTAPPQPRRPVVNKAARTPKKPLTKTVWRRICARENKKFKTKTGLPFKYKIEGNAIVPDRPRGKYPIEKDVLAQVLPLLPMSGPGKMPADIIGPSYLWAILHHDRIRRDDW